MDVLKISETRKEYNRNIVQCRGHTTWLKKTRINNNVKVHKTLKFFHMFPIKLETERGRECIDNS